MRPLGFGRDRAGLVDLAAGLAGGLFAPVATFGFGLPFWASVPGAILLFAGVRLAAAPRRLFEGLTLDDADRASLDLARDVLSGAQDQLGRLVAAARGVTNVPVRESLDRLGAIAARVVSEVEQKPRRLANVRRLLTYYLPSAARLAEGYRVLEASSAPDVARLRATASMIGQLDGVFARHADRLTEEEVDGLDVELRLLENSIREDQPC